MLHASCIMLPHQSPITTSLCSPPAEERHTNVEIQQRDEADDDTGPEGDLQDADAAGDLLVAPFSQAAVNLIELAVDAGFDLVELLVEVSISRPLDPPGDAAEQARILDLLLDRARPRRRRRGCRRGARLGRQK